MSDKLEQSREAVLNGLLQSKFEKVTPELLSEFLYIKGIQVVRCLMCGSEDMGIPQVTKHKYDDIKITYASPIKVETEGPGYSLMSYEYRIICKNCGFVSHFAALPVVNWVDKNSMKGGSGGSSVE